MDLSLPPRAIMPPGFEHSPALYDAQARKYEQRQGLDIISRRIGKAPVELFHTEHADIVAIPEYRNPSGSHHDRDAYLSIKKLVDAGFLRPNNDDELWDITSGSSGAAQAYYSALFGILSNCIIGDELALPENRALPMHAFGGNVYRVDGTIADAGVALNEYRDQLFETGWRSVVSHRRSYGMLVLKHPNIKQQKVFTYHADNQVGPIAFSGIAKRFVTLPPSIRPDAVVLAVGSWVTIAGISPVLRKLLPQTEIIGYEDAAYAPTAAFFNGDQSPDDQNGEHHTSYGLSYPGVRPKYTNYAYIEDASAIEQDARDAMELLINNSLDTTSKIGHTSLAGFVSAEQIAERLSRRLKRKPIIGCILYDQMIRC